MEDMSTEKTTQNCLGALSMAPFKKLLLSLVLFSIVLSGILIPVSFSKKSSGSVELSVAMAAKDLIKKDGIWYYGETAYRDYMEAIAAQNADSEDIYDPVTVDVGNTSFVEGLPPEKRAELGATAPFAKDGTCAGIGDFFLNPIVCAGRIVASVVASILISVAAWALAIAGVLFDWALMNAVILFKDVIFNPIKDGINIGWTAFRDISNIVIIGVFAFIAISIILGNKTFGDKKLVARVLVIAILINFSLLFTQMIIDASNFTAGQFYAATQDGGEKTLSQIIDAEKQSRIAGVPTASSGVSPFEGYSRRGIAGQFVNFLGVTDIADTYMATREISESTGNGWIMLVHALFAMILLLGAAIVLFYGSFLLISRAIILIFLLLTSAIAFASHLIPKMSDGHFGWKAWWQSLLGSAVLAPLLMIFLYITLVIAGNLTAGTSGTLTSAGSASTVRTTASVGAISQVAGVDTTQTGGSTAQPKGTLGNLISKSAGDGDINALFNYLLVLGLLFGSFKVASSFSSKIGGFNFAAMVPALGVGMAARMAGFAGRQTIGRAGTYIGESFASRAKAAGPGTMRGTMFDMAAQTFKKTGKRDFNMANTGFGKEIAGLAGLKGKWAGQTKVGGFEGDEKKLKDYFAEKGGRLTHSDDEIKKMAETAATSAATEIGNIGEAKKKLKEDTTKLQGYVAGTKERKDAIEKALKEEEATAENQRKLGGGQISRATETSLAEKQSALHAQDQRIKAAERLMGTYETKSAELDKQEVALKERRNEDIEKALPKGSVERDDEGNIRIKSRRERLGANAEEVAHKRITNLPWVLAGQTSGNDRLAKQMRDHVGDKETEKSFKKVIAAITEGNKADERRAKQERKSDAITHAHERVMENVAPQSHTQSNPNIGQEPKKDN